jgi:hypothetical protein
MGTGPLRSGENSPPSPTLRLTNGPNSARIQPLSFLSSEQSSPFLFSTLPRLLYTLDT